ncbi:MAG: hypothetical protein JSV96_09295 [Candidatus Aminicenantes bacterium]|nr:MAG: hypothetical protein JSV96_09295 [Candidatus Aminicenantes bacterium]
MSASILRALGTVLLGIIVVWIVWVAFIATKSEMPLDNAQVKLTMSDVEIIRIALENLVEGYNLGEEEKGYAIKSYEIFKKKITERIDEQMGVMSVDLPQGKNFASFSYRADKTSYHIVVQAKDKNGTMIHGTREKIWYE